MTQVQKRAVVYSFLAHIRNSATLAQGQLDIFVPIVKNALSELYPDGAVKGAKVSEIAEALVEKFGLNIPPTVMQVLMSKIAQEVNESSGSEDMQVFGDGSFIIRKFAFEEYKEQLQKCKDGVKNILGLFKKFCAINKLSPDADDISSLIKFIEQNQMEISRYLSAGGQEEDTTDYCLAAQFVQTFREFPQIYDTLRDIYLGSMLTNYLTYQPREVKMDVEVLVDTNFVVSLLDLNTAESTKTCRIFIETAQSLGYRFRVLKDTIEESQNLLMSKAKGLNSALVVRFINEEDIYNACDRRHLSCSDLERISDNIETILSEEFNIQPIPYTENFKKRAKFSEEYKFFKKIRGNDTSAMHDAIAVLYVKEKRGGKALYDFEKVNCWFVNNAINSIIRPADRDFSPKYSRNTRVPLPETIRVDYLLNIIWLSNPSSGILNVEQLNIGISSMVSYALRTSLPKSRVIRELDENIQKYKDDFSITDKDVVHLSTRIAQRQIEDIEALNNLADEDGEKFAQKVKEEALKQSNEDAERARKMDALLSEMANRIEDLRQSKENQNKAYSAQNKLLELEKESVDQARKMVQEDKEALAKVLENENLIKEDAWEAYRDDQLKRKQRIPRLWFYGSIIIILLVMGAFYISQDLQSFFYSIPSVVRYLGTVLFGFLGTVIVKNYIQWCWTPRTEVDFKSSLKRPDYLKPRHYEEISET